MKQKLINLAARFLTVIAILLLTSSPVAAANPLVLVIGGSGAASWTIGPIAPGQSGTKVITVQNGGIKPGDLKIWLSNIANTEGTSPEFEPNPGFIGELGEYLTLSVTSLRATTNLTMPALLTDFAQSSTDANCTKVNQLLPGEIVTLNWYWNLPPEVGNIVQGDCLDFTINYVLDDVPPPTLTPSSTPRSTTPRATATISTSTTTGHSNRTTKTTTTQPPPTATTTPSSTSITPAISTTNPLPASAGSIEIVLPGGTSVTVEVDEDNRLIEPYVITSEDGRLTLTLYAGTHIITGTGQLASRIVIANILNKDMPEGAIRLYDIITYFANGELAHVEFNPPALLTLRYNADELPDGATGIYISDFDENTNTWIKLEPLAGYTAQSGETAVPISHLSFYGIFADYPSTPFYATPEAAGLFWLIPIALLIVLVIIIYPFLTQITLSCRGRRR